MKLPSFNDSQARELRNLKLLEFKDSENCELRNSKLLKFRAPTFERSGI